jgi:hypothetical protein
VELVEVISTLFACGNGQDAVHDVLGKGWRLTEPTTI